MYVCICNAVTDRSIREAAREGATSFDELQRRTGCSDCCGSCEGLARSLFDEALQTHRTLTLPLVAAAA